MESNTKQITIAAKGLFLAVLIQFASLTFAANDSNEIKLSVNETKELEEYMKSSYSGVGLSFETAPKGLFIHNVIAGGPAEKAGVNTGEIIIEINSKSAIGMTTEQAVSLIKGPTGTSVNLKLLLKDGTIKQLSIVRDTIKIKSVETKIIEPNIGLLIFSGVTEDSSAKVKESLLYFQQKKIKGLIIDVRNNPGGYLGEMRKIASMIVGPNEVIWQYQKIGQNEREQIRSEGEKLAQWPTILIVSPYTASAAELLSSALKSKGYARLIGQNTRGHTTVYEFEKKSDGTGRKVPAGIFFTADGRPIQDKGISPDIELDPNLSNDEIIKKAVNELVNNNLQIAKHEKLTIGSDEFGLGEGVKVIWSITSCDGNTIELITETFEEIVLGDITFYKIFNTIDGKTNLNGYAKISKDSIEYYLPSGGKIPWKKINFPLYQGMTYEFQNCHGYKSKVKVEGPEEVNTPAGKYSCLVLVQNTVRDGNTITFKMWVAPGIGRVRTAVLCPSGSKCKEHISELKSIEAGNLTVGKFDFDPFVSPAFARDKWGAGKGIKEAISVCDIDTTTGAAGTPFSLKWIYDTNDKSTWVNVGLLLNRSWNNPVDLSKYDSISFYVKAAEKKNCDFKIQTAPWKDKILTSARFPLELTTEWQKVEIDFKTHPELKNIDLTKTYTLDFVDWSKENERKSNTIWLDEIILHKKQ